MVVAAKWWNEVLAAAARWSLPGCVDKWGGHRGRIIPTVRCGVEKRCRSGATAVARVVHASDIMQSSVSQNPTSGTRSKAKGMRSADDTEFPWQQVPDSTLYGSSMGSSASSFLPTLYGSDMGSDMGSSWPPLPAAPIRCHNDPTYSRLGWSCANWMGCKKPSRLERHFIPAHTSCATASPLSVFILCARGE